MMDIQDVPIYFFPVIMETISFLIKCQQKIRTIFNEFGRRPARLRRRLELLKCPDVVFNFLELGKTFLVCSEIHFYINALNIAIKHIGKFRK